MTFGAVEAGALVGGSGLLSVIISKIKCYYKRPSFLCGFTDTNIINNDDVHVDITTVNDVDLLYVSKKQAPSVFDSDDGDNDMFNNYCNY